MKLLPRIRVACIGGLRVSSHRRFCTLLALLASLAALAYPPAPYHTIYGVVRSEMGNPILANKAQVILSTTAGVELTTTINSTLKPGMNYRLQIPMDAGLTAAAYKPTALNPTVPFRLKVKIGETVYLPIEMRANFSNLGKPAQSTRMDLTLGEDADGDGLPDAWQRALRQALGDTALTGPNDDADGDGLSNLQEYLAGTYAFDAQDGFRLEIIGKNGNNPILQFLAIRGRSYSFQTSTDLEDWTQASFRLCSEGSDAPSRRSYEPADVRTQQVELDLPEGVIAESMFFKARVQ